MTFRIERYAPHSPYGCPWVVEVGHKCPPDISGDTLYPLKEALEYVRQQQDIFIRYLHERVLYRLVANDGKVIMLP